MTEKSSNTDGPKDRSDHRSRRSGLLVGLILVLVYVGSIGPAFLITNFQLNGHLNRARFSSRGQLVCETLYWPICRACEKSDWVTTGVSSYLGVWQRAFSKASP